MRPSGADGEVVGTRRVCPQNYRHSTSNIVGATNGRLLNAECRTQNAELRGRFREGRSDSPLFER